MNDASKQTCPHCGAELPPQASFCPHCAQSLISPKKVQVPFRFWKKILYFGGAAAAIAAVALGIFFYLQPRTYDSFGEVMYTDEDGTYQILVACSNNRFTPQGEVTTQGEVEEQYRMPSRLFINHADTGANAGQIFLQKVDSVTTQFIQPEDSSSPMVCSQPEYLEGAPEAALVSLLDYTGRSDSAELLWTLHMNNGDTIKLRQKITVTPIETYDYHYEDYPMDTMEQLQALVDQISEEVPMPTVVNLHLPPVTYQGELAIEGRPINLYGSQEGDQRTTFTDTVRVTAQDGPIIYFYDLNFEGSGEEIGISASARFWAENCSFTGWKTGVLGYGSSWINVIACQFTDNGIGFHFNSDGEYVSHSMFNDNTFLKNDTAVLLERVPTDVIMNFQGSHFSQNGVDIDNRCSQPLDISQAIFD